MASKAPDIDDGISDRIWSFSPPHRRAQHAHRALRGAPVAADILVWTRQEFDRFLPVAGSLAATILREGRLLYGA
ncbi:MAG TPA: hypothetical protein VFH48_18530 [Chloroflexota bacterium]|nr:hypothetical protein [Chloroflexota bacterium]